MFFEIWPKLSKNITWKNPDHSFCPTPFLPEKINIQKKTPPMYIQTEYFDRSRNPYGGPEIITLQITSPGKIPPLLRQKIPCPPMDLEGDKKYMTAYYDKLHAWAHSYFSANIRTMMAKY